MTCQELKEFDNKTVAVTFRDGETATARLSCLNDGCEEVLIDILGTNRPERYRGPHACSYIVTALDIVSVTEVALSGSELEPKESETDLAAAA